jgi:hypothetical protein
MRIIELKREKIIAGVRKLHEKQHDSYFVPNIVRVMLSRITGWTRRVTSMIKKGKAVPLRSIEAHLGVRRYMAPTVP